MPLSGIEAMIRHQLVDEQLAKVPAIPRAAAATLARSAAARRGGAARVGLLLPERLHFVPGDTDRGGWSAHGLAVLTGSCSA